MAVGPAGAPISKGDERGDEERSAVELEHANSNRGLTVGLAGTSVAILTFALFFLFDRSQSGVFDPLLFRITVGDLVSSMFVLGYSGTCYYWQMEALLRRPSRAAGYQAWADSLFVLGLMLLLAAPFLILITARLWDVGALALALWLVMLLLVARRRPIGH
jgi:hypothetical protein